MNWKKRLPQYLKKMLITEVTRYTPNDLLRTGAAKEHPVNTNPVIETILGYFSTTLTTRIYIRIHLDLPPELFDNSILAHFVVD
jgi:hypothetical protein